MSANEQEPDGFKLAAEQNMISARFNARTNAVRDPALKQFHSSMMAAAHNGALATFSAMHPTLQKSIVNWRDSGTTSEGPTALMVAASRGHVEIAKHLLSIGADVSLEDDMGRAAIHFAAQNGKRGMAEILLNAGADVNHSTINGWTPLMYAADSAKKAETVQLLLEHGAHTRIPTPNKESIRARAGRLGLTHITNLIDTEEMKRGGAVAAKMVEKGTAETMTVSRPLRLKNSPR